MKLRFKHIDYYELQIQDNQRLLNRVKFVPVPMMPKVERSTILTIQDIYPTSEFLRVDNSKLARLFQAKEVSFLTSVTSLVDNVEPPVPKLLTTGTYYGLEEPFPRADTLECIETPSFDPPSSYLESVKNLCPLLYESQPTRFETFETNFATAKSKLCEEPTQIPGDSLLDSLPLVEIPLEAPIDTVPVPFVEVIVVQNYSPPLRQLLPSLPPMTTTEYTPFAEEHIHQTLKTLESIESTQSPIAVCGFVEDFKDSEDNGIPSIELPIILLQDSDYFWFSPNLPRIQTKEPTKQLSFEQEAKKIESQLLYLDLQWLDTSLQPIKLPNVPQLYHSENTILDLLKSEMNLKKLVIPRFVMWDMDYLYRFQELLYPPIVTLPPLQDILVKSVEDILTIDKDIEVPEVLLDFEDSCESEVRRYIDQLRREGYEPASRDIEDHGTGLILQFQAKVDSLPSFEEFHHLLNKMSKHKRPTNSVIDKFQKKSHVTKKRDTLSPSPIDKRIKADALKSLSVRDSIEEYMKLRGKGRTNSGGKNFEWENSKLSFPSNRVLYEYHVDIIKNIKFKNTLLVMPQHLRPQVVIGIYLHSCISQYGNEGFKAIWMFSKSQYEEECAFLTSFFEPPIKVTTFPPNSPCDILLLSDEIKDSELQQTTLNQFPLLICSFRVNRMKVKAIMNKMNKSQVLLYSVQPPVMKNLDDIGREFKTEQVITRTTQDPDVQMYNKLNQSFQVEISDHIRDILYIVTHTCLPYVQSLTQQHILPSDTNVETISIEYIRNLLGNYVAKLPESITIVKDLIRVFTLRMVCKSLVEGGISHGYRFLHSSYQNPKYTKTLEEVFLQLYPIMERAMDEIEAGLYVEHPLMHALQELLIHYLQETQNQVFKAAILVKNENLIQGIKEYLSTIENGIQLENNCFVVPVTTCLEWTRFSLIIMYDSNEWMDSAELTPFVAGGGIIVKLSVKDPYVNNVVDKDAATEEWILNLRKNASTSYSQRKYFEFLYKLIV